MSDQVSKESVSEDKVIFYHLVHHRPIDLIQRLCEKTLAKGGRVMLRAPEPRALDQLDDLLWSADPLSFLPHGKEGADQPVLLGQGAVENDAKVLMLLAGCQVDPDEARKMERLCYLFEDADDSQMQAARNEWKAVVAAGLLAEYWTDKEGTWALKARSGASP